MQLIMPNIRQEDYLIPVLASTKLSNRHPHLVSTATNVPGSCMQVRINVQTLVVRLPLPSQHAPVQLLPPVES